MKKFITSLLILPLVIGGILTTHVLYLYTHPEFNPQDWRHPFLFHSHLLKSPPDEVSKILCQTFTYLGRGKQMTAFESEDHQYVIKFFNPRPALGDKWFRSIKKLRRLCSLKWISGAYFKREERLTKLFERYRMGFEELKEEAALVYVHLDGKLEKTLHLFDKGGREHFFSLDQCPFVLQKKAELLPLYKEKIGGNPEQLQQLTAQIYHLFLSRAQKGYTDRNQTPKNYGVVEGRVIQMDLGRIKKDPSVQEDPLRELERVISNVALSFPELSP